MDNTGLFRLRIHFAKQGRLKWLSHLELVRALERCIRRAALPFLLSQGFNQHMKRSFGPALPVGTAGREELCDVWLSSYLPASQALANLQAVAVSDLPILSCEYINKEAAALEASHCMARYQITLQADLQQFASELRKLIAGGELIQIKKGKPKTFDLSNIVVDWHLENDLYLTLRSSNDGSLRPERLLAPVMEQLPSSQILSIVRTHLFQEN